MYSISLADSYIEKSNLSTSVINADPNVFLQASQAKLKGSESGYISRYLDTGDLHKNMFDVFFIDTSGGNGNLSHILNYWDTAVTGDNDKFITYLSNPLDYI